MYKNINKNTTVGQSRFFLSADRLREHRHTTRASKQINTGARSENAKITREDEDFRGAWCVSRCGCVVAHAGKRRITYYPSYYYYFYY